MVEANEVNGLLRLPTHAGLHRFTITERQDPPRVSFPRGEPTLTRRDEPGRILSPRLEVREGKPPEAEGKLGSDDGQLSHKRSWKGCRQSAQSANRRFLELRFRPI